ncbi:MAG TPA: hypothetical protein EYN80_01325 [Alphaproteobacteria bacterium]|nr:hypothetical protein [Alphaproteobacteria bacterium]
MDIGAYFFPTAYSIDVVELATELEQRGFESLLVPEHTHIPVQNCFMARIFSFSNLKRLEY